MITTMKKKLLYALFAATAIMATSCELDEKPYHMADESSVAGGDVGTIEAVTSGSYSFLKEEYFIKPLHYVGEYGGDNIALSGSTTDNLMYLYNYQRIPDSYQTSYFWNRSYKIIVNANKILSLTKEGTSEKMDQLLGENYFLRGWLYFSLSNIFGRPYAQSPEANLSVPLKLTANMDDYPARATVKAVYEQVVKDLKNAERLTNQARGNTYATKTAAQALLSRVYLYMGENKLAEEYATKVIDSGNYSLLGTEDFKKYSTFTPEANSETIFAIKFVKDKDNLDWSSVGSMYAEIDNVGWGEMYASLPYRQLLDKNPSDARHAFIEPQYILDAAGKKQYCFMFVEKVVNTVGVEQRFFRFDKVTPEVVNGVTKYKLEAAPKAPFKAYKDQYLAEENGKLVLYAKKAIDAAEFTRYEVEIDYLLADRAGYPKYFVNKCSRQEGQAQLWSPVILRLAEMYLNRAEARAKQGNIAGALEDVNVIRERAQTPTYSALPQGVDIVDLVLEERRLELAYEGHRKFDIFRNGKTLDRRYPGTHDRGSATAVKFTVEPTDKAVIELIPQREINAYPVPLVQNPL